MSAPAPACAARTDGYARRRPEETLLYELVRAHWPRFVERAEERGGGLPQFVVREFEEYLRCGILEHGLVHVECARCGHAIVCAFSCKRRGFCPSCLGRRMSDMAAHLVDELLPEVAIRQWVCSLPWSVRYALAYDRRLCADVLDGFIGALTRSLRRRAKRQLGLSSVEDALVGAVTFIQRVDSALRINPHFHTIVLDGAYVRDDEGKLVFHALPEPSGEEVAQVAEWTHAALVRVLARHGRSLDGVEDAPDRLRDEEPALASCYAASAADVQLLGEAPGQRTSKLVRPLRVVPSPAEPVAEVGGVSEVKSCMAERTQSAELRDFGEDDEHAGGRAVNVHAKVAFDGRDRARLERLCRYVARPPLSQERLSMHPDGRVKLSFKAAWKDGTHAVLLDPLDFIGRLCALIPPPRVHMTRYHGVLAGRASARAEVVFGRAPPPAEAQLPLFTPSDLPPLAPPPPPSRHPWPWLLKSVFAVDIETCPVPGCGGRMRLVELATEPDDIARVMAELSGDDAARAPPGRPRPSPPGQLRLAFG